MRGRQWTVCLAALTLIAAGCGSTAATGAPASPAGSQAPSATGELPATPISSASLAPDQTFRFPISSDIGTIDPAHAGSEIDISVVRNVFSGLYGFDNDNNVVPDLATGMPDISADGLTYTFHLRSGIKFSNGDLVTAADVLYSWNRAAALQDGYAYIFQPIEGYDAVVARTATTMSGLTSPDPLTIVAHITAPTGYWLTELAFWTASVVDKSVIEAKGEDSWWQTPDGLVGTGPFKMTARTPGQSLDFAPVTDWWGGSTGALTAVHVEILADSTSQIAKFESGGYDVIGYLFDNVPPNVALSYSKDPSLSSQLKLLPNPMTIWVGYNFKIGPFVGDAGKLGREAFSMALDRSQLVNIACVGGLTCEPATGGPIAKGSIGYLGDAADANATFDPARAKQLYQEWDPDGSKVSGLKLSYPAGQPLYELVFGNVQAQWEANLGVAVQLDPIERATFIEQRLSQQLVLFQNGWGADFNHPQNWLDTSFSTKSGFNRAAYSNAAFDKLIEQANPLPLEQSLPLYEQAEKLLIDDVAYCPLYYATRPMLIKPYVQGAGAIGEFENLWVGISLLED